MPNSNIDELSLYRSGGGVNGKTLSLNRSGKPNLDIDEVKLYLGGWGLSPGMEVTHNIKSYSINYDMFGRGGTFECSLMADNEFIVAIFGPTMLISLSQAPILFRWVINGHNWMSGFLDKKEVQYDNNGLSVTVYGRDYMQILTDNTILFPRTVPDPQLPSSLKYLAGNTSKSLPELIMGYWLENSYVPEVTNYNPDGSVTTRPLTKNLDITAYLDPEPFRYTTTAIKILQERMPVFYKISADVGESLFDLFSRLCNQIGLFMFNPPGTNYIVIHAAIPPPPATFSGLSFDYRGYTGSQNSGKPFYIYNKEDNRGQNNVISCTFTEDITKYCKYIKLIGTAQDEGSAQATKFLTTQGTNKNQLRAEKIEGVLDMDKDGNPIKTPISPQDLNNNGKSYMGLTKLRSSNVDSIDSNTWYRTRDLLLSNSLIQQNKDLYNFKYTVVNHSPTAGGVPFFFGQVVHITDDWLGCSDVKAIIYSVTYTGSKEEGLKTELELASPASDIGVWFQGQMS